MNITEATEKISSKQDLEHDEIKSVMSSIMSGECTEIEIISFLMSLKTKGESIVEIGGAAEILREMSTKLKLDDPEIVDTCGTGGDSANTFNISTTAAVVAAAAGVKIAKHGNKSVSSKSGSADLLEHAGFNINLSLEEAIDCYKKNNLTFMFAPKYHSAMKNVAKARAQVKTRTIFNLLGPLANPAGAKKQIIGVYDQSLVVPIAQVASKLGLQRVMVVHSEDGLDEISCHKKTYIAEVNQGDLSEYTVAPGDFGIEPCPLDNLKVNSVEESYKIFMDVLENKNQDAINIVAMNAGAAIYISGITKSMQDGFKLAKEKIISGEALKKLTAIKQYQSTIDKTDTVLTEILAHKKTEIAEKKKKLSVEALAEINYMEGLKRDFKSSLLEKIKKNEPAVIAEIKRASPSKGEIRMDINPGTVASTYEQMGATCLSVLTDSKYFKGSGVILELAKKACNLPVLRKDFIIDEYQIEESVAMGADCILLIVAALKKDQLETLYKKAKDKNLDVITEVHDAEELDVALEVGCDIIGINNRNLHNFEVNLNTTLELLGKIDEEKLVITESGIKTKDDVELMKKNGVHSFLVGESFMVSDDPIKKYKEIFE